VGLALSPVTTPHPPHLHGVHPRPNGGGRRGGSEKERRGGKRGGRREGGKGVRRGSEEEWGEKGLCRSMNVYLTAHSTKLT